jgi:hypothetical protein
MPDSTTAYLTAGVWTIYYPDTLYAKYIEYDCTTPDQLKKLDIKYLPDEVILPIVSNDDENKVLGVRDGIWKAIDPSNGGGSTGLPSVTENDEDKVLVVRDGEWIVGYPKQLILHSSTENSNKLFALSVDDEGTLTVRSINE